LLEQAGGLNEEEEEEKRLSHPTRLLKRKTGW
jgi:hypothetical protein